MGSKKQLVPSCFFDPNLTPVVSFVCVAITDFKVYFLFYFE